MRFRILGHLETHTYERQLVRLSAAKQRSLLSILLLHGNQPVSVDRLVDGIWGNRMPRSAERVLRTYVAAVRKKLHLGRHSDPPELVTVPGGYHLRLAEHDLDLMVFDRLTQRGRAALATGDVSTAATSLQEALDLWRSRPLEDVPLHGDLATEATWLEERRLAALETWVQSRLELGEHVDVAAELPALVAEQPLRERLRAHWMLALHRSGRRADALAAYRDLRATMTGELGIEPGQDIQRLHQRILSEDPTLDLPPRSRGMSTATVRSLPRQLPVATDAFTGRCLETIKLRGLLHPSDSPGNTIIAAVNGLAGVGKSALAVSVAHQVVDRFPDGQLYADLRGTTTGRAPVQPVAVLGRFLRALGLAATEIPGEEEEAAAVFRARVANRRLLVVLDNAAGVDQTRPLLPACPNCVVLVTSREVLATLNGTARLRLGVLTAAESRELLGKLAGPARLADDPEATQRVAELCGHLPLALRIAGARLMARPTWPVGALADRLADAETRLDELRFADLAVRDSFQASYQALVDSDQPDDRDAAATFPQLAWLGDLEFTVDAAAGPLRRPMPSTETVLERLVDAELLESPAPGRYQFHELVRLFARDIAGPNGRPR